MVAEALAWYGSNLGLKEKSKWSSAVKSVISEPTSANPNNRHYSRTHTYIRANCLPTLSSSNSRYWRHSIAGKGVFNHTGAEMSPKLPQATDFLKSLLANLHLTDLSQTNTTSLIHSSDLHALLPRGNNHGEYNFPWSSFLPIQKRGVDLEDGGCDLLVHIRLHLETWPDMHRRYVSRRYESSLHILSNWPPPTVFHFLLFPGNPVDHLTVIYIFLKWKTQSTRIIESLKQE